MSFESDSDLAIELAARENVARRYGCDEYRVMRTAR
jgi:hypothetical protein